MDCSRDGEFARRARSSLFRSIRDSIYETLYDADRTFSMEILKKITGEEVVHREYFLGSLIEM